MGASRVVCLTGRIQAGYVECVATGDERVSAEQGFRRPAVHLDSVMCVPRLTLINALQLKDRRSGTESASTASHRHKTLYLRVADGTELAYELEHVRVKNTSARKRKHRSSNSSARHAAICLPAFHHRPQSDSPRARGLKNASAAVPVHALQHAAVSRARVVSSCASDHKVSAPRNVSAIAAHGH